MRNTAIHWLAVLLRKSVQIDGVWRGLRDRASVDTSET